MLGWLRDKIYKRHSSEARLSIASTGSCSRNAFDQDSCNPTLPTVVAAMEVEDINRINFQIIYMGEVWIVNVDRHKILLDILKMAICHFSDLANLFSEEESVLKFKFISASKKRVLSLQCSVIEEGINNNEKILLVEKISLKPSHPVKLSIQDIKGPSTQEIFAATANLTRKNTVQVVPSFECQDTVEIRKVLYSLVETSARILAQTPDAKALFTGIADRISAKYKKEIDKNSIKYLMDLGFTEAQARYALRLKRNRQVEAMEWLLEHGDRVKDIPDTGDPQWDVEVESDDPVAIVEQLLRNMLDFQRHHFDPNARSVEALTAMGFGQGEVMEALRLTDNNQVLACRWLCGERDSSIVDSSPSLDKDGPMYKALMANPAIQLGLYNPKILLAFLSILDNFGSANLWLNDVDTAPVLGQVFKIFHAEKHMIVVNQQIELMRRANAS